MNNKQESRFVSNIEICSSWEEVTKAFDQLPKPAFIQEEGETYREGWIYRGHKSQTYCLEPSIERESKSHDWAMMEHEILKEFQKRAPMHMDPSHLPPLNCRLSWLAIMQHYGAPTRLLDFTESPYLALYFALRHRKKEEPGTHAEVWGIDPSALIQRAKSIFHKAEKDARAHEKPIAPTLPRLASSNPKFMISPLQSLQTEEDLEDQWVHIALKPSSIYSWHFKRQGLIALASPPMQNIRLSSQQGVFLFNGAEDHSFEDSLELMMGGCSGQWYKRFRIPVEALPKVEEQLFQMNIHDLSLFPDAEGLAGFLRQKLRLYLNPLRGVSPS